MMYTVSLKGKFPVQQVTAEALLPSPPLPKVFVRVSFDSTPSPLFQEYNKLTNNLPRESTWTTGSQVVILNYSVMRLSI